MTYILCNKTPYKYAIQLFRSKMLHLNVGMHHACYLLIIIVIKIRNQ